MDTPIFSNGFNVVSGNPNEFILTFRYQEPSAQKEEGTPLFRVALSRNGLVVLARLLDNVIKETANKLKTDNPGDRS